MGRFDKAYTGGGPYSIAELIHDTVALDGVSCLSCHMQREEGIGTEFSVTSTSIRSMWSMVRTVTYSGHP
jgi:hypothetical protein